MAHLASKNAAELARSLASAPTRQGSNTPAPKIATLQAFAFAALCLLSCSSSLEQIPRGTHPLSGGAAPLAVDSAPPPARVDEIRAAPASHCAWADGQWRWENNRWQWQPGAWVRFKPGCYYADSLMSWVPTPSGSGVLFYTHGQWYTAQGQICSPPTPC